MDQDLVEKTAKPSLFGMIWSPGEQFDKIRKNPRILVPLLIITAIYFVGAMISVIGLSIDDLSSLGFTEADAEIMDAELFLTVIKIITVVSGILSPVFGILISTVVFLLIVMIAKKKTTFRQLFSMNTYIMLIGALGLLLNNFIQVLTGGPLEVYSTSLAALFNSTSPVLATFELFSIWQMVLTAFGLNKVARLSKGASWIIVIIFFLLNLGMAVISTFLAGVAGV